MGHIDTSITEPERNGQQSPPETSKKRRLAGLRLALPAGLLLWLAFPAIHLWPLAWVAIAPLLMSIHRARSLRQASWRGYVFGWAFLGPVCYWAGLTVSTWTQSPIGWFGWFGLILILALYYAVWSGFTWWLLRRMSGGWQIVAPAAAWVVLEWGRTLGAASMPWAQLSYSQYKFTPILQFADVTGAYGVSFLIMLVNGALAFWLLNRQHADSRRRLRTICAITGALALYGFVRLQLTDTGKSLRVAAMQANFNSFHIPSIQEQYQTFTDLMASASRTVPSPALYVWAESTAPEDALNNYRTHRFMRALAHDTNAAILVGTRVSDTSDHFESNAVVLFPPNGGRVARYDKQQLVPFGEFIPLRETLEPVFGRTFGFPEMDVQPGKLVTVLHYADPGAGDVALGPFICYESIYPVCARRMADAGATLLVTQSNDSWFRSEAAMEQHLSAAVLRAVENRRQVIRSTTTGITCIIDAEGRIRRQAPINTPAFVTDTVQLLKSRTIYTRFGDWFVLLCGVLIVGSLRKRPNPRSLP